MSEESTCAICGHPMPEGETMFQYHGYSGPCPDKPRIPVAPRTDYNEALTDTAMLTNSADAQWKENKRLLSELTAAQARIADGKIMADFAKGAIHDAIATEDGLDGETGQQVMCIITEWQERGTFDKTLCEHMTSFEKHASEAIDEDAYYEIEALKRTIATQRETIQKQREWMRNEGHRDDCNYWLCTTCDCYHASVSMRNVAHAFTPSICSCGLTALDERSKEQL